MLVRLTMICCGLTAASRRGFFPADESLDDRVLAGISALAENLDTATRIWTSPVLRARQTAEALGLQAADVPALKDQDFGAWSGRAFEDVQRAQPDVASAWLVDPGATPPDGENFRSIAARVAALFDEQVAEPGHTIAVTHPAVIRAAILHVLKAPLNGFQFIDVEPLSIADFRSDGTRWQLRASGVTMPKAQRR
ncbi:MAG TPA: histidine phosphatase family protein [Mesorhizobium sp.]|jgi:broad specificity phosphatase PhoE|uniref:histidine phosphatase family protein n=1 Tax=Mesorhizobium sp. TaxID=1871066 RepID=UPI002DDCAC71|nr:histidine phosphatase family protein [Mesorhizobium sp.]HEV2503257.1 histidine phosphatase family protein [Mesorhizobium sp.]